jgi:hypothetical protein
MLHRPGRRAYTYATMACTFHSPDKRMFTAPTCIRLCSYGIHIIQLSSANACSTDAIQVLVSSDVLMPVECISCSRATMYALFEGRWGTSSYHHNSRTWLSLFSDKPSRWICSAECKSWGRRHRCTSSHRLCRCHCSSNLCGQERRQVLSGQHSLTVSNDIAPRYLHNRC